jgi:hypothetical protein
VVGFLRVDQPVTAHRYRSPWRRNRGLARISRSSRSSRFSRRSRRSSSRSAVVSPSVRWPASRSAWRTHWRTAVSVRSSSLETWPTVLVLRMSSTTYALYSGGKNRRGRGIGMSTSRPTTSGSWPHVPGSPGAGLVVACQSLCSTQSPRKYLASRTRNTVAAIIRHRNSFHAGASSTHDELFPLPVSIRALGMLTARAFNVWEPLFSGQRPRLPAARRHPSQYGTPAGRRSASRCPCPGGRGVSDGSAPR